MSTVRRFTEREVDAFTAAKILGVRSGDEHRCTGAWVVVVERRVFVRSWNDKPNGWFRAFLDEPATKGSKRWVDGFAEPSREANTLELVRR